MPGAAGTGNNSDVLTTTTVTCDDSLMTSVFAANDGVGTSLCTVYLAGAWAETGERARYHLGPCKGVHCVYLGLHSWPTLVLSVDGTVCRDRDSLQVDINLLGARCSDGSAAGTAGGFGATANDTISGRFTVDYLCPEGACAGLGIGAQETYHTSSC